MQDSPKAVNPATCPGVKVQTIHISSGDIRRCACAPCAWALKTQRHLTFVQVSFIGFPPFSPTWDFPPR